MKVPFYILDSVTSDFDKIIQMKNSETTPMVTQGLQPEISPLLIPVKNPEKNMMTSPEKQPEKNSETQISNPLRNSEITPVN
jgi:hypothetical protein